MSYSIRVRQIVTVLLRSEGGIMCHEKYAVAVTVNVKR
jgi:hypothetical protein